MIIVHLVPEEMKHTNNMELAMPGMGVTSQSDRFLEFLYSTNGKRDQKIVKMINRTEASKPRILNTKNPSSVNQCTSTGERRCEDGSCIARVELCPEEQLMNQNTILIMIVVGLAVVVFLVILYCFQQRQRRANRELGGDTGLTDDCDNASLYAPPPSYEDVVTSNLYPVTPQQRRLRQLSADEEAISPLTPPPNYDTALIILAQSQDSVFNKPRRSSSLYRRSVSLEQVNGQNRRSTNDGDNESLKSKTKRTKNFFRFSRQCSQTSANSSLCRSPSLVPHSPPPYPQTPPVYPLTPPPPFTPTYTPSQTQIQLQHSTGSEVIS